jgi:hypothetical protein
MNFSAVDQALVHKSIKNEKGSHSFLSDALRDRHSELGHAVDHGAGDPGLGLLRGESAGAQTRTDEGLLAKQRRFDERPFPVAHRFLPAQASPFLDRFARGGCAEKNRSAGWSAVDIGASIAGPSRKCHLEGSQSLS